MSKPRESNKLQALVVVCTVRSDLTLFRTLVSSFGKAVVLNAAAEQNALSVAILSRDRHGNTADEDDGYTAAEESEDGITALPAPRTRMVAALLAIKAGVNQTTHRRGREHRSWLPQ